MAGLSTVLQMAMKAAPKAAPKAMPRTVQQARPTEIIEDSSETIIENISTPKGIEKIVDEIGESKSINIVPSITPPKKTIKAYKLFKVHPKTKELFPLFVKWGDDNLPLPINKWVKAEEGIQAGSGKVKSSLGELAYRPGFHGGDLPVATHIGDKWDLKKLVKDKTLKKPNIRPDNQVWAEVEMADDVDWQSIANSRAIPLKSGKGIQVKTAHITDQVPFGGNYRYKTNPNMTGNWIISGDMKINKILSNEEVKKINKKAGVSDLPKLNDVVKKKNKGGMVARNPYPKARGIY